MLLNIGSELFIVQMGISFVLNHMRCDLFADILEH